VHRTAGRKPRDFKIESVKMAQYYSNAYFTLAAGSAANSREGFLRKRSPAVAGPCGLDYGRPLPPGSLRWASQLGSVFACLPSSGMTGPLEKRAWTFQESFLSRRTLVYGEQQLSFKCQTRHIWEDGDVRPASRAFFYRKPTVSSGLNVTPQASHLSKKQMQTLHWWYHLLPEFTARAIQDPSDRLAALSGIAERFHETLQCRYLFGLWEIDIIRGLLWKDRNDSRYKVVHLK